MIYKGSNKAITIYKGNTKIIKAYKGSDLVYSAGKLELGDLIVNGRITFLGKVWGLDNPFGNSKNLLFGVNEYNAFQGTSTVEETVDPDGIPCVKYTYSGRYKEDGWHPKFRGTDEFMAFFRDKPGSTNCVVSGRYDSNPNHGYPVFLGIGRGGTNLMYITSTAEVKNWTTLNSDMNSYPSRISQDRANPYSNSYTVNVYLYTLGMTEA